MLFHRLPPFREGICLCIKREFFQLNFFFFFLCDTCRDLHRLLSAQCHWSSPGRDHALWPAQNDQFSVSGHLLGKVMRLRRAPVKGPQKACCLSKCFGSQSPPWMPPVSGLSGEPGGWMTVKDEGGKREGKSEEQARTEGLICCRRRKEGGGCVSESLMSPLQQLLNKSVVRYVLLCGCGAINSDWVSVS